jgi:hypothetical protein
MDQGNSAASTAAMLLACVFVASGAFAGEPDAQVRVETLGFKI